MAAIRASMRRFQVARQERDENAAALRALVAAARMSLAKEEVDREVVEKDFSAVVQLDLPREARRFHASEFAPFVLQKFRRLVDVPTAELRNSLCEAGAPVRDLASQGRSGAHFYRTQDGKFLIKCLSKTDAKALRSMLSDLYAHITRSSPASLLSPPLALFKVDHPLPKSLAFPSKFFLITRHLAPEARLVLDLKGCLLHRRATTEPMRNPQSVYHVLKDRDILESRAQLVLTNPLRSSILSQLHDDLEFLKDRGIIDYSLLLALTETGKKRRKAKDTKKAEEKVEKEDVAGTEEQEVFAMDEWESIEAPEMRHNDKGTVEEKVDEEKAEEKSENNAEEEEEEDEEEEEEEEEREMAAESENPTSAPGVPVRLRINSFVNSTLSKPHAVLQDLSDVNPGSLRLQVSIIDYLTHYGLYHRMAGLIKHIRYGNNVSTSTEPPTQYRFRLQAFAEHVVTSI